MAWQARRALDLPYFGGGRKYKNVGLRAPRPLRRRALVLIEVDQAQLKELEARLKALPETVRKRVVKSGFKRWGKSAIAFARSNTPVRTGRLRAAVTQRIRTYRKVVWTAIGGRVDTAANLGKRLGGAKLKARKSELGNDYLGAGWRLHFAEEGFHPRGGKTFVRGRGMMRRAAMLSRMSLVPTLEAEMQAAAKERGLA